jgi:hypothetical protein
MAEKAVDIQTRRENKLSLTKNEPLFNENETPGKESKPNRNVHANVVSLW